MVLIISPNPFTPRYMKLLAMQSGEAHFSMLAILIRKLKKFALILEKLPLGWSW